MNPSFKRIISDIKDLAKSPIEGVYYFPDEDNILNGYALIIGPQGTPYQYGNYIFNFYFSEEYPYKPPKVVYKTNDGKTRFNPNFYRSGKVCLSILNTWSGDQWSACQTIRSILLTLQTTLNDLPLLNEPGVTMANKPCVMQYNQIIEYKNIEFAIMYYIKNPERIPTTCPEIVKEVFNNYRKTKADIMKIVTEWKGRKQGVKVNSQIYDMKFVLDYSTLYDEVKQMINDK